jgi:hypothetical protein
VAKKRKVKSEVEETKVSSSEIDAPKSEADYEIESLQLVKLRYDSAKVPQEELQTKRKKWNDNFRSHLTVDADYPFRSQIFVPITEKILRALLAKYIVALFLRRPFFDLKPRTHADKQQVERIKAMLMYTFDKMPDFIPNMIRFIQMMLIYGTALGKVYWRKIYRYVGQKKEKVCIYNGPYFEPLDISNFLIDPSATKLNGFYKIHRSYQTMHNLKAAGIYKNLDKVTTKPQGLSIIDTQIQDRLGVRGLSEPTQPVLEYDTVELWEYWSEDDSRLIVVANGSTVIRDEANPFWHGEHPFVASVYEPLPFEFWGKGLCEKLSSHQSMINTLTNEIIDNVKLMNNKMWIAVVGAANANQIASKAGKIIWVDDINAIRPVDFSPIPGDAYRMLDRLTYDCESSTASTSMSTAIGTPITKEQSATEVSVLSRLSNEVHALNIMLLEIPALMEIVRKCYELIKQNCNEEFVLQVTGGEEGWDLFTPEDIAIDVDIIPKVGIDVLSKEVISNNLVSLLNVLKDMPGYDMEQIVKLYVENLGYHVEDFKKEMIGAGFAPVESKREGTATSMLPGVGNVGELPPAPAATTIPPAEEVA